MDLETSPTTVGSSVELKKLSAMTISLDRLDSKFKRIQQLHALGIVLIPFLGTIAALILAVYRGVNAIEIGLLTVMYVITSLAITVGFHRHFSHCTFQTYRGIRILLAICGSMACQGPIIYWVSNHRRHHQYSDEPGDTHSPYFKSDRTLTGWAGFWHAHVGWTFDPEITNTFVFGKDLLRERDIAKVNQLYYAWVALSLLLPTVLGWILIGNWSGAISGFLWGGCVRLFFTYHVTNSINSVTHLWGRRPFDTRERSTNNIWLAIPTGGEAWHNNHHAFPNSAIFGLEWWQLDLGGWLIRFLKWIHLAWDVKVPSRNAIAAKKKSGQSTTLDGSTRE